MTEPTIKILPENSNYALVPAGPNHTAIVSREDYPTLSHYTWQTVKSRWGLYVQASYTIDGKKHHICMHRLVAHTPRGQVCHHINRRTLDNRRENLINMDKRAHAMLHTNDNILIKYGEECLPASGTGGSND